MNFDEVNQLINDSPNLQTAVDRIINTMNDNKDWKLGGDLEETAKIFEVLKSLPHDTFEIPWLGLRPLPEMRIVPYLSPFFRKPPPLRLSNMLNAMSQEEWYRATHGSWDKEE